MADIIAALDVVVLRFYRDLPLAGVVAAGADVAFFNAKRTSVRHMRFQIRLPALAPGKRNP